MIKEIEIDVFPNNIDDYSLVKKLAAKKLKVDPSEVKSFRIIRRSIDSRKRPVYRLRGMAYINEMPVDTDTTINYKPVRSERSVIIVGSGPAGLFAALRLIELGIKPVVIERGKDVQARRRDIRNLMQEEIVNPDSNYCFGEGGAGTYSDGKLYTRSKKRGDVARILNILVQHDAANDILIDAHPHVGSNKLPKVIESMRRTILNNNGEVHFNSKLTGLIIKNNIIRGVVVNGTEEYSADAVILATGHSARDIYYLLNDMNIQIESKPFAMGVRVEHPQALIDSIQYKSAKRPDKLPAASYNLNCQIDNRGVYSFCMCPGGIIVPSATEPGELVLNGMSVSRRDSEFANSGLVVEITERDTSPYKEHGIFAGLEYQKHLERIAFEAGGNNQKAPAQRITDFTDNRLSTDLNKSSYIPGVFSAPLNELLPADIVKRLQRSLRMFDKRMKGYYTNEAQILAAETRTSSTIRIPRDRDTRMHIGVKGLFPSGEGAGYAGGIVSAAIDGEKSAEAAVKYLHL